MEMLTRKKKPVTIAVIILILLALGYFLYRSINTWHKKGVDVAIERESKNWQLKADTLKEKIIYLQEELRLEKEAPISEDKLFDAFGEDAILIAAEEKMNCDIIERQIKAFFGYLDQKDYIKAYKLENGTSGLFQQTQKSLSQTPPTVVGEMRDLFTLIHNLAHFYRALGKNQLTLIQTIVENEADIIEPAMAIFYAWFSHDEPCEVNAMRPPPLKLLYEYAGFFLNTLGGRSYLFRRDSKLSALISYYSILVLDRAYDEALNPYGIDIRPFIDYLIYDIANRKGLIYQRKYMTKLEGLKQKYQM